MTTATLRATQPEDLPAITDIYGIEVSQGIASFEEQTPTLAEMTDRWHSLTDQGYPHRVATLNGAVMGYAYASSHRPRAAYRHTVESSIYLAGAARGQGIGKALMADLIAQCEVGPWTQMIAVIGNSANTTSIGLHRSVGFRMVGTFTDVGFKHGQWVDTVLMQRVLLAKAPG